MTQFPPIPEMVWQQPSETSVSHHELDEIFNHFIIKTNQEAQRLTNTQISNVAVP